MLVVQMLDDEPAVAEQLAVGKATACAFRVLRHSNAVLVVPLPQQLCDQAVACTHTEGPKW